MYRTDFEFLEAMFPYESYENYDVLIVNQTDDKRHLVSALENIRVINTEERGLSQSRNLAIKEAIGEICLVADDDVRYVKDLKTSITAAYKKHQDAVVITFQMTNFEGELYRNYPNISVHAQKTIESVNGVVISFKPEALRNTNTYYDPHFGLGCTFQTANEFVFMKNVLQSGLRALFVKEVILSHPNHSSGREMGSDRVIYARAALMHKYYGYLSYLWVFKYLRFLVAHKYITWKEISKKIKIGFSGIARYRKLGT